MSVAWAQTSGSSPLAVTASVDAATAQGTLQTQLSTNIVWPGDISQSAQAMANLAAYHPPLVRIHAGTDSSPSVLPEQKAGDWDFSGMDDLVNTVRSYGAEPVLNVKYAPDSFWTCTTAGGTGMLKDTTYNAFARYMARLVSYYNRGSMVTESGQVITNPAGTKNRITYWEIWNEPDISNETPCHPADGSAALTPDQYVRMWNVVVPAMRAVDPTIKLVGPATTAANTGYTPDYLPTLMAHATYLPDIVSFHGYGGWDNSQKDLEMFDGSDATDGLAGIIQSVDQARAWAPGKPIWITEMNVNGDWGNDPAKRPWTGYGIAWGASAFYHLALKGVALINQYDFMESPQFGLVDDNTGAPNLPYWRDRLLSQAFPPGSTLLACTSSSPGIETMAVRDASGAISVLVINRQVNSPSAIGGPGVPADVTLNLKNINPTQVRALQMDSTTNPATGPTAVALPASQVTQLHFNGYGMAVVEIVGTNTVTATATPTATATHAPDSPQPQAKARQTGGGSSPAANIALWLLSLAVVVFITLAGAVVWWRHR